MAERLTNAERAARRQMYLERELERAHADAAIRERSIKCGGGGAWQHWPKLHAGTEDGCQNDGTTCLCECHDDPESGDPSTLTA